MAIERVRESMGLDNRAEGNDGRYDPLDRGPLPDVMQGEHIEWAQVQPTEFDEIARQVSACEQALLSAHEERDALRQQLAASEAAAAQMRQCLQAEQAFWVAVTECPDCDVETGHYCEDVHQDEFERMESMKRDALFIDAGAAFLVELSQLRVVADAAREVDVFYWGNTEPNAWPGRPEVCHELRRALAALPQSPQRAVQGQEGGCTVKDGAKDRGA